MILSHGFSLLPDAGLAVAGIIDLYPDLTIISFFIKESPARPGLVPGSFSNPIH